MARYGSDCIAFQIDERPGKAYLDFVRQRPGWAPSRVKPIFADEGYLAGRTREEGAAPSGSPSSGRAWTLDGAARRMGFRCARSLPEEDR